MSCLQWAAGEKTCVISPAPGLVKFSMLLMVTGHWLACMWVMEAEITRDEAAEIAGCLNEQESGNPTAGCEQWGGPSAMKHTCVSHVE